MERNKISVAKIVSSTSVDGVGLRTALYVAGCNLRCPDCHNKEWWNIENGTLTDIEEVYCQLMEPDENISILGGEPMLQYEAIVELCRMIKQRTDKTIWLWSGHTFADIQEHYPDILEYIDVLVDGPFIQEYFQPNLKWRGSTNQNVIDIKSIFQK